MTGESGVDLQSLMNLIGELQKTIAVLTAKLESYELRDEMIRIGGVNMNPSPIPNPCSDQNPKILHGQDKEGASPFSVNFGDA